MMQINDNLYIHHISLNPKATSQFKHMIVRYTIGSGPEAEKKSAFKARPCRFRVLAKSVRVRLQNSLQFGSS